MQIPSEILGDLDLFLSAAGPSSGDIVLEQSENSDLLPNCKPANRLFFWRVFGQGGSFWKAYEKLGLGKSPRFDNYIAFIGNRMYFCRNTAARQVHSGGLKKKIALSQDSIAEETEISLDNLALLIATPFEQVKIAARMGYATARLGELAEESEKFFGFSREYCSKNAAGDYEKPLAKFQESVAFASSAMEFSVCALAAMTIKAALPRTSAIDECEANGFSAFQAENGNEKEAIKKYGFLCANPYDLSLPRYSEAPAQARLLGPAPQIVSPYLKWRENAKFAAARFLAIARKSLLLEAANLEIPERKIFYLSKEELAAGEKAGQLAKTADENEKKFNRNAAYAYPQAFALHNGNWVALGFSTSLEIRGTPVGALKTATGKAVRILSESDYGKASAGCIIICDSLSPSLVTLYSIAAGVASKSGGLLSHAAIVAREQGLPCISKTINLDRIREGDEITLDGEKGTIIVN